MFGCKEYCIHNTNGYRLTTIYGFIVEGGSRQQFYIYVTNYSSNYKKTNITVINRQ